MQGDKAKVSEHIEAPELCINTKHPTHHIRVRRLSMTLSLTEDLLGPVLTFNIEL